MLRVLVTGRHIQLALQAGDTDDRLVAGLHFRGGVKMTFRTPYCQLKWRPCCSHRFPCPSPFPCVFLDPVQLSAENDDLSEYAVHLEAMPGSPLAQDFPEPGPITPGPSDLTEFQVPEVEASLGSREPAPAGQCVEDPPPRWVRSCVELPGYARGWVPLSSPTHSTMLYTMMQVDGILEDQVVHGRASTEQT